ncbi:T9SS type A sorting domain-containing protein [Algoriphagus namhaensis]
MRTVLFCILFLPIKTLAQQQFFFGSEKSIQLENSTPSSPFSGGINSAQLHEVELTGDDTPEWVLWDINSRQLQVYAQSAEGFIHRPELSYFFPEDISGFLAVADYDGDGKKDLFTSTRLGIRAYRNTSKNGNISFELARDVLRLDSGPNIQANNLDTPLLRDLDLDGDLDLVIFNFASGDYLEFYLNTSIERKGQADLDGFAFPVAFWGDFVFCGCADFSFGSTCEGIPLNPENRITENARVQHAGGHSILYEDLDGDGEDDLILGRDECDRLYFLPNKGTTADPLFDSFSTTLPGFGDTPEFPRFHVGQLIADDLVISLNTNEASFNFGIDFARSVVKLSPGNAPISPVLQNDVFDLGENSRPFFRGNKSSGTLWITYNSLTASGSRSHLAQFSYADGQFIEERISDPDFLALDLLDAQYLEFLDQSGSEQKIALGLRYEGNIPTPRLFRKMNDTFTEFVISGYTPDRGDYLQFFSFESADYLLVAARNGSLDLYSVDFSTNTAELIENDFLDFSDNPANRNLFVTVDQKSEPDLYAVDQLGKIVHIQDFMNSGRKTEISLSIGAENVSTRLGRINPLAIVPPLFTENPDLVLGSAAGGLIYLQSSTQLPPGEGEFLVKVYPNPTSGKFKVLANRNSTGRLINSLGQILLDKMTIPANQEIEIQTQVFQPGIYFLQLETEDRKVVAKKVLVR